MQDDQEDGRGSEGSAVSAMPDWVAHVPVVGTWVGPYLRVRMQPMRLSANSKSVRVIAVSVLVALFIPIPQTIAPDWTVTTLDATHRPLKGITVREVWQQYSLENTSHEEDRLSDDKGEARFPRRQRWTSVGARFFGCAWQILSGGVHGSCGPRSYLVAFGKGVDTMDWEDLGPQNGTTFPWQHSTLVLKH